ncbi:MAG: hypothetical protein ACRDOY_08110 [Nocardioidaceae bacterium]
MQVGDRHVFQTGAHGGVEPLARPHHPRPNHDAPEAEWGADPGFGSAVAAWCRAHGHPLVRLYYTGPQAPGLLDL